MAVDDSMTNTQQQVYNGDHRKYFEFPCIVLTNLQSKWNIKRDKMSIKLVEGGTELTTIIEYN